MMEDQVGDRRQTCADVIAARSRHVGKEDKQGHRVGLPAAYTQALPAAASRTSATKSTSSTGCFIPTPTPKPAELQLDQPHGLAQLRARADLVVHDDVDGPPGPKDRPRTDGVLIQLTSAECLVVDYAAGVAVWTLGRRRWVILECGNMSEFLGTLAMVITLFLLPFTTLLDSLTRMPFLYIHNHNAFTPPIPTTPATTLNGIIALASSNGSTLNYNSQFTGIPGTSLNVDLQTLEACGIAEITDYPAGATVFTDINLELVGGEVSSLKSETVDNDKQDGLVASVDKDGADYDHVLNKGLREGEIQI
ncbi:hypothetical protein B0H13DRAFT_2319950 [Mycena leptocephala]|nr:hypothetical protein B0H13DRAFT_2319950 [Mycena leptocephala]